MKKIITLLVFLSFISCRYFNVSPVDGFFTTNLTEKPLNKDFVGTWEMDKLSYDLVYQKGYGYKKNELIIRNDGSFKVKNFPDLIDVFSKDKSKNYISSEGHWKIDKDFDGEKWIVSLEFDKNKTISKNLSMEFELYLQDDNLILWYFVGDPDSGERLLLEKQ